MALRGLAGKVAIVTGAASGIGAASAQRLSAEGARLVVVDVNREGAEEVAGALGGPALAVAADVSCEDDVEDYMRSAVERFGRVDLHHVNAGIAGAFAPLDLTAAEFDEVIAVNLRGVFLGLRAAFRQFREQDDGGAIVTTASISALRGSSDLVPYHTAKHGVVGLTRCAAVYGGPLGVRVNAVAPGIIPTGLRSQSVDEAAASSGAAARAKVTPLGREGTAEEVAALVAFLLSGEAEYVTGEVLSIDGGAIATNPFRPSRPAVPLTEGVS